MKELGITIRYTPPYTPQSNSVERVNRVIGPMIAEYVETDQWEWDKFIPQMCFAINTAKHESKRYTPAFLNYGRELLAPGSITRESTDVTAPLDEERQSQLAAELRKLPAIFERARRKMAESF